MLPRAPRTGRFCRLLWSFAVVFSVYPLGAFASDVAPYAVQVDKAVDHVDISRAWMYQASQRFDTHEAPSMGYTPVEPAPAVFNELGNAYWFKLRLNNESSIDLVRILHIDNTRISLARLNVLQDGALIDSATDGMMLDQRGKTLPTGQPTFEISVPGNTSLDVYLYLASRDVMRIDSGLWEPQAFARHLAERSLLLGFLVAAIAILGIYNLLIAFFTTQREYLHLGLFLTSLTLLQVVTHDLGAVYLWPAVPWLTGHLLGPFLILTTATLVRFSMQFLGLRHAWFARLGFWAIVAIVLVGMLPVARLIMAAAFLCLVPVCWVFGHAFIRALSGNQQARQYLYAFTPLFIAVLIAGGNRALDLGLSITTGQLLIASGSAALSLALAVALANRIKTLAQDRQASQHKTLIANFQAREAEHQADLAHQENKAKSLFLATMSHEIRTPMNGILGMADLLQQTELKHQQTNYLATLQRSGQSLMGILNDILDYSKVEAGRLELDLQPTNLRELLDDIGLLHREQARVVRLHINVHPETSLQVVTDPLRLKQIICNLVNNAIKFTDAGFVTVEVEPDQKRGSGNADLLFKISDTGIGIDDAALDSLFDRFKQADSSISRKFGGTGLGLAIARSLVELLGGEITVQSTVGVGTTFTFNVTAKRSLDSPEPPLLQATDLTYVGSDPHLAAALASICAASHVPFQQTLDLDGCDDGTPVLVDVDYGVDHSHISIGPGGQVELPVILQELNSAIHENARAKSVAEAPVETEAANQPLAASRILVVEDNATNRLFVGKLLQTWGADVQFANDGEQALAAFEDKCDALDLILMDCEMPVMDGYTAAQRIREKSTIPIIALTAHALPEFRDRALNAGMTDYITKPIEKEILLTAIKQQL